MDQIKQMQHSRQKHLQAIGDYVNQVLLPGLNHSGKVSVEPTVYGRQSHVYFLEGEGFNPVVLRGEENRTQLRRRIRGHQLLLRQGFDVPIIVHQDLRSAVRQKYGFYFVVESRIPGCHFNSAKDTGSAGTRLGAMLAQMHQITSWGLGWPGEFRWPGSIIAGIKWYRKAGELLAKYRRGNGRSADDIARWLKQQPIRAWFPRPRLTTGGFISSNVMVAGDRVVIIDLARVRYGNAARDLAQIRFVLTRYDEKARAAFFEGYRQSASKALRAEYKITQRLFEGIFLIRRAVKENDAGQHRGCVQELLKYCQI
jgi:aminoglycoside phosphotransferase (APT) family kinase protein